MRKTAHRFDWEKGHYKERILSRSFDSMEEAVKFAEGKDGVDVYVSKGRYKVEWMKTVDNND